MGTIKRFEEIEAWQTARELTQSVYRLTGVPPFSKDFGLRDQIRRAAVSAMSNIAEGFESHTRAMFVDYLGRARGSAGEVRSQLYVALDVGYLEKKEFEKVSDVAAKCSAQIERLRRYLRSLPNEVREDHAWYDGDILSAESQSSLDLD